MNHTAEVSSGRTIVTEPAELTRGGMVASTRRRVQHPLERMRARGQITTRQAAAGERLYAAWALGVVGARDADKGCNAWTPAGYTDAQLAALQDFRLAREALDDRLWSVAHAVCCHEWTVRALAAGATGRASGHAVTRLMDMLRQALLNLASHYSIPDVE